MIQGFPHRETCRSLEPLSSEGLTLFDWNLSLAVRLRVPEVSGNAWSLPATASLPPEMLSGAHGGSDVLLYAEDQTINGSLSQNSITLQERAWQSPSERLTETPESNELRGVLALPGHGGRRSTFVFSESDNQTQHRSRRHSQSRASDGESHSVPGKPLRTSIFALNRTITCDLPNGPPVDLTVRFEFDGYKLDTRIFCSYWIINLTSLPLRYIPSCLPSSASSLATSAYDPIELPACETFIESLGVEPTKISTIPVVHTTLTNSNFIYMKYQMSAAARISRHLLETVEHKIPQLTSQLHDGFRVESDMFGTSSRCDICIPRSTNTSTSSSLETIEKTSLVSLSRASAPFIQQTIQVKNLGCSVSYIMCFFLSLFHA